jgi:hypothetical protein
MATNPTSYLGFDWNRFFSYIFLLSHEMAGLIRSQDQAKRYDRNPVARRDICANVALPAFSPHEAHMHQRFFAWIMPTIKTPELVILQIVGLDAAVVCA